jgi:ATP-dependent Clp protease ATP-binding subunit ClpB
MDSVPTALDEITRKILTLQVEKEALKKEKDELSIKRLEKIDEELYDLKESFEGKINWQKVKGHSGHVHNEKAKRGASRHRPWPSRFFSRPNLPRDIAVLP